MPSAYAKELAAHRARLKQAGFRRISCWISPELQTRLWKTRRYKDCVGRQLERLILGKAAARPAFWSDEELAAREQRVQTEKSE